MLGWPQQRGPIEAPTPARVAPAGAEGRVALKKTLLPHLKWPKPGGVGSKCDNNKKNRLAKDWSQVFLLKAEDRLSSVPLKESTQPASGLCLRPSEDLASHSLLPACASTCHEHPAKLRAKVKTHASWGHQIALFSKYPKMKSFLKNKFTKVRTLFEVICMRQISGAFI